MRRRGWLLVDGDYCTEVRQTCIAWEDPPNSPLARCAKFAPSECAGSRVRKRFCIDRDEYVAPGETLPRGDLSWTDAKATCEGQHKRLCKETEWELACEGEQMLPYPTGYERDATAVQLPDKEQHLVDERTGKLRDQREFTSAVLERCVSPFGVRSMIGNVDEWVWRDRTAGEWRSGAQGRLVDGRPRPLPPRDDRARRAFPRAPRRSSLLLRREWVTRVLRSRIARSRSPRAPPTRKAI